MNLRAIIVSMSLLGLISNPTFASVADNFSHSTTSQKKVVVPSKTSNTSFKERLWSYLGYKDKDSWVTQQKHCGQDKVDLILLDAMQGTNRSMPNPCHPGWFDRIQLSGGLNFDTAKFGNRNVGNPPVVGSTGQGYTGENIDKFSLNDAYLNVAANPTDWTYAFASFSFINASMYYSPAYQTSPNSLTFGDNNNTFALQQAFVRLGNFEYSPLFIELGQEFQDFGRYETHPITEGMPQVLTETLRTSLKLGYYRDTGLHGSIYSFQDPVAKVGSSTKNFNYGMAVGYDQMDPHFGYDLGIGYLYNIFGINSFGNKTAFNGGVQLPSGSYYTRVGAVAMYGDVNFDSLQLNFRYMLADRRMNALDMPLDLVHPTEGAKPWAVGVQGTYGFYRWHKPQHVYAGYQVSRETVYLNLPRARWLVGYGMDVLRYTAVALEWNHDIAYPVADGGATQGNSNLVSARVAIKFG